MTKTAESVTDLSQTLSVLNRWSPTSVTNVDVANYSGCIILDVFENIRKEDHPGRKRTIHGSQQTIFGQNKRSFVAQADGLWVKEVEDSNQNFQMCKHLSYETCKQTIVLVKSNLFITNSLRKKQTIPKYPNLIRN